jgi:hypothetical protein
VESKVYLTNPNSSNAAAAHQQAALLEGINSVLNSEPVITAAAVSAATAADDVLLETTISVTNNKNKNNNPRTSPTLFFRSTGTDEDTKSKNSPALMMAEASLLSQQAALKDADNLNKMISLQEEEMKIRREDSVVQREERKEELRLQAVERERISFVLQNLWTSYVLM